MGRASSSLRMCRGAAAPLPLLDASRLRCGSACPRTESSAWGTSTGPLGGTLERLHAHVVAGVPVPRPRRRDPPAPLGRIGSAQLSLGARALNESMCYYRKHPISVTSTARGDGIDLELSAKVLRNNLEILDRFAPEDLEFMDPAGSPFEAFQVQIRTHRRLHLPTWIAKGITRGLRRGPSCYERLLG